MKTVFPTTYTPYLFHREIDEGSLKKFERIEIDFVPEKLKSEIMSICAATIGNIRPGMSKKQLLTATRDASYGLHEVIPWQFCESGKEFYSYSNYVDLVEDFQKQYFSYFSSNKPHKLSELCNKQELNCIGQSFAMLESIQNPSWGLYADRKKFGSIHHLPATPIKDENIDDVVVTLDPITGPFRERNGRNVDDIYVYDAQVFEHLYHEAPSLKLLK